MEAVMEKTEVLPKGWKTVQLGDVLEDVVGGGTPSRNVERYWNGDIPWITVKDMRTRRPELIQEHITQAGVDECATNIIPADTVITATRVGLGKVVRVPYPAAINQDLKALIVGPDLDKSYLEWWIIANADYIDSIGSGTTVKGIRLNQLRELKLPLAPLPQQRRIVSAIELQLGRLDAAVARLHAAKAKLKRYKQAVLKAAVEGALTEEWREKNKKNLPSAEKVIADLKKARDEAFKKLQKVERGDGERQVRKPKDIEPLTEDELASLPELPEGWAYARVGNAVNDIFDGPFGSHLKSVDYIDAGVRVIRLENIVFLGFRDDLKSYVSEEKYNSIRNHTVGAGDIIFSSFINEQTRVAVLPDHIDLAINKSDCFCVRIGNVPMDRNYVHYFLSSDLAYSQLVHGIHGATRPRINTTQLKQCPIPICGLDEQREIARLVGDALAATEAMETTLDAELLRSTRLRQAVLKRAFEGRLV